MTTTGASRVLLVLSQVARRLLPTSHKTLTLYSVTKYLYSRASDPRMDKKQLRCHLPGSRAALIACNNVKVKKPTVIHAPLTDEGGGNVVVVHLIFPNGAHYERADSHFSLSKEQFPGRPLSPEPRTLLKAPSGAERGEAFPQPFVENWSRGELLAPILSHYKKLEAGHSPGEGSLLIAGHYEEQEKGEFTRLKLTNQTTGDHNVTTAAALEQCNSSQISPNTSPVSTCNSGTLTYYLLRRDKKKSVGKSPPFRSLRGESTMGRAGSKSSFASPVRRDWDVPAPPAEHEAGWQPEQVS
ncbi:hypothetical protein Bbelb_406030 [Branchiostoma belcheri]|nr:hypothetical protein Bbelb_406030 [Branchiostoma belcheri]